LRSDSPLANRVCGGVVAVFALWTLCVHATVALGGDFHDLLLAYAIALLALATVWRWLRPVGDAPAADPAPAGDDTRPAYEPILRGVGLALAVAIAATAVDSSGGVIRSWSFGVALLAGAAVFFLLLDAPAFAAPLRGRGPESALWALAIFCALIAVCVHRPDLDDTFYVNVAVAAVDHPDVALMSRDTMLGVADLPMHQPAHRIHSYELWNAAIAWLTHVPAILTFHWISAGFFGLLLALAHARWLRLLTPRVWPWTVAALIFVLLCVGETHRWFGNFALVRMWQGKGVYLYVFMPLVYAYAMEFARSPSLSRFGLLWAAQVAAVGCSSTAIWAAPVGSLVAMSAVLRPNGAGLRRLALGALASVYVLGIGFALKGNLQPLLAPMIETYPPGGQLANALRFTLGSDRLWSVGIATLFGAWACCPRGLAQRFAIAAPLAVSVVLLNPYLDQWVSGNLTGPSYWRSLWALPVPALMALVLVSPLQFATGNAARRIAAFAACASLALAFALFVPQFGALSARNGGAGGVGIWLGRPQVKAPPDLYALASALNAAVPEGAVVIAPPDVGIWIPTQHGHAYPLQSRKLYLERHRASLGAADVKMRIFLTQYAGGETMAEMPHLRFAQGLQRFDVKGVLLRESALAPGARTVLTQHGFERVSRLGEHEIWVRRE